MELKSNSTINNMLDQETLRPVIIAMALYLAINIIVPRILKKPTGIKAVDDLVMTMIAQQDALMNGTILVGLVVLGTNYIQDELL
ncbi:hypothetical protein APZ24_gp200 [Ostreococcus lucimarinus virus 2]|jgi:hypothetical protein|uniref:hypothetical protein n=1 Tax=Ostreococcus tauri virus 2 TaxID=696472 RepID=UPI0001EF46AB|nr:hypothetical protein OtV2_215 [Ostreococcus tauri virus 2]YP_007674670.1 hypothetical protein OLNG_00024 [Ostreococcus lucimarinus virus OlV5]YP_009172739.1 hypothetical protein APZ24_gp200 [Ostreococcus lucimarinus virus 2]AFK65779.1 hypothetical protein OLVG_00021 [Ostreococcus lucimarinus virus OlV6]AFK66025.1 hypothetical protein OMVG_00020 [Ostreococcus lucimarinus virus OlV3]AGH31101.1 hypothetical protein OLNG_00024 [Ostreococcus lucimarinus virus OlV5]ALI95611.1 hypothetical protei